MTSGGHFAGYKVHENVVICLKELFVDRADLIRMAGGIDNAEMHALGSDFFWDTQTCESLLQLSFEMLRNEWWTLHCLRCIRRF